MNRFLLTLVSLIVTGIVISSKWSYKAYVDWTYKRSMKQNHNGPVRQGRIVIPLSINKYGHLYGTLVVGTPKNGEPEQVFRCYFDTGSPQLWILGKDACKDRDCRDFRLYDREKSTTFKSTGNPFKDSFVGGKKVSGIASRDRIKIGIGEGNSMVVQDQVFGEAFHYELMFDRDEAIFGMSLTSWNKVPGKPEPTIWSLMKRFANPVFSFHTNIDSVAHNGGKLVFGGNDEEFYDGELNTHDVVKAGEDYDGWFIKVDEMSVTGELAKIKAEKMLANFDSNALYFGGPTWAIDRINRAIYNAAGFSYTSYGPDDFIPNFPCAMMSLFPDVTFKMNGKHYTFTANEYIMRFQGSASWCVTSFKAFHTPHIILGQIFLNKYYTRFDVGNKQIQIAKLKKA